MLQPKRTKYRKAHKGRIHGKPPRAASVLSYGAFGLKALEPERITARQIEAARRTISRAMKRQGRLWILIFPDVPVSKKPAEVRMGSGKGAHRILGLPRASRPHHVRAGWRAVERCQGSVYPRGGQAADQNQIHVQRERCRLKESKRIDALEKYC